MMMILVWNEMLKYFEMKCWNSYHNLCWVLDIFWKDNIPVLTGEIEMVKWLYMKNVVVEYVPRKVDGK